jgi:hypothetical protein
MTETEWSACGDPIVMVDFLQGVSSARKLRLFAVSACRAIKIKDYHPAMWEALLAAERYADRLIDEQQLWTVQRTALQVGNKLQMFSPDLWPAWCAGVRIDVLNITKSFCYSSKRPADVVLLKLCQLLRDIVGNPFHLALLVHSWLAWNDATIPKIAQAIYDERAFDRMPILADALEDAGCDDADILRHCREPGEHVRGCWVIDLLLGKE